MISHFGGFPAAARRNLTAVPHCDQLWLASSLGFDVVLRGEPDVGPDTRVVLGHREEGSASTAFIAQRRVAESSTPLALGLAARRPSRSQQASDLWS